MFKRFLLALIVVGTIAGFATLAVPQPEKAVAKPGAAPIEVLEPAPVA